MPLKSLMQDDLIDFIGVRAEKTRQLYELGIRRFFEINGFRSEEHALFILRERVLLVEKEGKIIVSRRVPKKTDNQRN